jgi:tryptophan 2,3-dioxygenase
MAMATETNLTYGTYLHVDELLGLQDGVAPADAPAHVRAAEHFFMVVHQAFELWFKQQLLDLACATDALAAPDPNPDLALEHLTRVAEIQRHLNAQMALLDQLPPRSFLEFRPLLGTASGAESAQFYKVARALGLRSLDGSPVYCAFSAALAEAGLDVETLYRDPARNPALYRVAEALVDIAERFWLMTAYHVRAADRAIGDRPGTGGTSGVAYLMEALHEKAFPDLWTVRTRL